MLKALGWKEIKLRAGRKKGFVVEEPPSVVVLWTYAEKMCCKVQKLWWIMQKWAYAKK